MAERVERDGLQVAAAMARFIEDRALPGTGVTPAAFWAGLSDIVHRLGPKNRALLDKRAALQAQIDGWHRERRGQRFDPAAYRAFLEEIGYLVPEGPDFRIETANTDPEIAQIPGPQLVVPVTNARYALNAANARWGSLYDALYGTDALGDLPAGKGYDPARGARVVDWAKAHLDRAVPLEGVPWSQVKGLEVRDGRLVVVTAEGETGLARPEQFLGWADNGDWRHLLFGVNGLKIEMLLNPDYAIGRDDPAGIAGVNLEAAVSAIMDCEDSVATVDAEDKVLAWGNWLGLMKGDLTEEVAKGGETFTRKLYSDFTYQTPSGKPLVVKCLRSTLPLDACSRRTARRRRCRGI
jgi:malate synthase